MTTVTTGHKAEVAAADYLKKLGYKILDTNWRTRYCEIDIIAQRNKTIHFAEVKYRVRDSQGKGLDFITSTKLRQMRYAADLWVSQNEWDGDYLLSALEISGLDFKVTEFVPDCA